MKRRTGLAGAFVGMLLVFFLLLWRLQVWEGEAYRQKATQGTTVTTTLPAARGKLLDRNGEVLAQDVVTWEITLSEDLSETDREQLAALCAQEGVAWDETGSVESPTPRLLAALLERPISGVTCRQTVTRWDSGTLAPQVLGRVGKMSQKDWETYAPLGYPLDEEVGKEGAEYAFQSLLRGTPGTLTQLLDTQGNLMGQTTCAPQAGRDVTLTLDKGLQTAAAAALEAFLEDHPQSAGGAVVALDVSDGGVLAMVSLPGYDSSTFSQDYADLAADPSSPLMNRAIQGLYAPGSTFKLVTAAAALEEGILTPETQILDTGTYTYYPSPQPQCWLYRQEGKTHGLETLSQALADSCNVFFYDAGRRVGIETLARYANLLGLGEVTGIELLGEAAGVVAGPAYTQSIGGTWYTGSVLSAAIGQENNRFTPLQLARMTAALVGGTRSVHLLYGDSRPQESPILSEETVAAIKEGMLTVTQSGSLAAAFRDLPVTAGAKTGSAQVSGSDTANGILVCFAPYDDPQIALAVVVEQAGAGAALGETAASILGAFFGEEGS